MEDSRLDPQNGKLEEENSPDPLVAGPIGSGGRIFRSSHPSADWTVAWSYGEWLQSSKKPSSLVHLDLHPKNIGGDIFKDPLLANNY